MQANISLPPRFGRQAAPLPVLRRPGMQAETDSLLPAVEMKPKSPMSVL